jgi:hypothetical protein
MYKKKPVVENTPDHPEGSIENVGDDGHLGKVMVVVDEGQPEGLGEVGDDALGQHDPQEADPYLDHGSYIHMWAHNAPCTRYRCQISRDFSFLLKLSQNFPFSQNEISRK